jgi:hypothetical protein
VSREKNYPIENEKRFNPMNKQIAVRILSLSLVGRRSPNPIVVKLVIAK